LLFLITSHIPNIAAPNVIAQSFPLQRWCQFYKELAESCGYPPTLLWELRNAPLIPTCQRAFGILDWGSMGPLLKNAIIGLSDVYAKFLPNEKELLKILHYSTAVANYAILWK
jgi:hypothetical protein